MFKTRRGMRLSLVTLILPALTICAWHFVPAGMRELIMPTAYAATFTVNTLADHDDGTCDAADCTLREAINAVNGGSGGDTISFNIPGSGVRTINLSSALPVIGKAVSINGTTQQGFSGFPLIELNGAGAGGGANGLVLNSGAITVSSLIINRFPGYGIDIENSAMAVLTGNYIGTDATGASAAPNGAGGIKSNVSGAIIGAGASPKNVISGNNGSGVDILIGAPSIQNNFIGTNAAGTGALPNTGPGINITQGQAAIGGSSAAVRNIISGNGAEGILINQSPLITVFQGNYIGTDVTGSVRIGNGAKGGVHIINSNGHTIGGANPGEGNVLSGNIGGSGFGIEEDNSNNLTIQGNIIGLNAAGTAKIQNDPGGIILFGGSGHTIGGTTAGARNVISGNGGAGILILAVQTQVQGNYFGTNAAGTAALGNGASGILINGGDNNTIGGTTAAARNVISGNGNGGVRIVFSADNNVVQGNFIGTDVNGTNGLGNGVNFAGVLIQGNCVNDTIGGVAAGAGNLIAFNQGPGVWVPDSTNSPILGNSIYSNAGLGIDLGGNGTTPDGVTPNDACDADTGGNNLQNFPVITSVTPGATNTTIAGTLNSTASTQFRLEFFANTSCDPAGNGEGKTLIGSTNVTTDAACNASFNLVVPNATITGPMITATATDPSNNTSEFSACAFAPLTNTIQFNVSTLSVSEGTPDAIVTVNRFGDTSAPATVAYGTSDNAGSQPCNVFNGNASLRCDYLITLGTLQFAANETSKTIMIPIIDDTYKEGDETFSFGLSNPTGATIGSPDTVTITITDNDGVTGPANPIDQTAFFVRQHYLDFLNREPDTSGFNFWSGNIDNCTPKPQCTDVQRINASAAFFLSIEFQQTGYLVERFYKVAYGDATGSSTFNGAHMLPVPKVRFVEFLTDTQRIGRGVVVLQTGWEQVLEANKQAYAGEFVQTTRFKTAFPTTMTPTQFVNQLFDNAGLPHSGSDYTTAINFFNGAGDTTNVTARAQAVRQVAENTTLYNAEFNRAFVLAQYFGYLRRNPDDPQDTDYTGFDFWLTKLNQSNGDYLASEMVKAFMTSNEYRQRSGP